MLSVSFSQHLTCGIALTCASSTIALRVYRVVVLDPRHFHSLPLAGPEHRGVSEKGAWRQLAHRSMPETSASLPTCLAISIWKAEVLVKADEYSVDGVVESTQLLQWLSFTSRLDGSNGVSFWLIIFCKLPTHRYLFIIKSWSWRNSQRGWCAQYWTLEW